jgi:hypothetical protein
MRPVSRFQSAAITSTIALLAMSFFVTASFAATPQNTEWHITLIDSCKNVSFCGGILLASENGTAAGATRGTITLRLSLQEWTSSGQIVLTERGMIKGTWTTGSDGDFIVTGIETISAVTPTGSATVRTHITAEDSGIQVKPLSLNCRQIYQMSCPAGVRASETVTETTS